jgi:hypothetical protein
MLHAQRLHFLNMGTEKGFESRGARVSLAWRVVFNLGYLLFNAAVRVSGFENKESARMGFTVTLSMMIFSGGTGVSLDPVAVFATGRTLVSKTKGIWRPFTGR